MRDQEAPWKDLVFNDERNQALELHPRTTPRRRQEWRARRASFCRSGRGSPLKDVTIIIPRRKSRL